MSGLIWCALALAPQAQAATFAELPFAGQPGAATCLRATGEPDAACDVLARAGRKGHRRDASADASLPGPGTARLALSPSILATSPWRGMTTIAVQAGPPGGMAALRARARVRVRLFPPPPLARPLDVRARRTPGGRVVVTWRTAVPARRVIYVVQARPIPRRYDPDSFAYRRGRGRSSFRAVLKLPRSVHRVAVGAFSIDNARNERTVTVRISG